ncbi:flagellar basal body protein FliL [Sphingomonas koreensis]|uniref:Flagellar protein FliL n=1 Tax=Sphingomonas koreensis TaxID=93064 RepID=A0A430G1F0_9SPHN|nr:flagellar basal body protein FliL [Sphingomonas koreensis]
MNVASDAIIDVTPIEVRKDKPKTRTKLLIAGCGAALLLAAAGGGAWWMLRDTGGGDEAAAPAAASAATDGASYIEAPTLTVNLRSGDGQARFLKLRFILVAANPGKVDSIKERLPVVLDALQPFLRELRPEDLAGSAAVFRIKEEMMSRTTQALGAGTVRDVLIQDLVQQ